jgi:hypothetical protein
VVVKAGSYKLRAYLFHAQAADLSPPVQGLPVAPLITTIQTHPVSMMKQPRCSNLTHWWIYYPTTNLTSDLFTITRQKYLINQMPSVCSRLLSPGDRAMLEHGTYLVWTGTIAIDGVLDGAMGKVWDNTHQSRIIKLIKLSCWYISYRLFFNQY